MNRPDHRPAAWGTTPARAPSRATHEAPTATAPTAAAPRTFFLTAQQRAIVQHTGRAVVVAALAGTGKTTTLASKLLHHAQRQPHSRILVLACSHAGAAAFRTRLQQLAPQGLADSTFVHITSLERWCARQLRRRDASTQFLSDPIAQRQEALAAAQALQERLLREPDDLVQLPAQLDVDAFWQFHRMAQKSLLLPRWQAEGCSLAHWCDQHLLDYSLARWYLAYERQRMDHCGDPRYYAHGECTHALAQEAEAGGGHDWEHYDLVLFDELHDMDLASLHVLRQLLQPAHTSFVGAGDFNQHIDMHALPVLQGQLQQLHDFVPMPCTTLPLTVSRRFGPPLAEAVNGLFDVHMQAMPQRKTQVHRWRYDNDAHCIAMLLEAHQHLRDNHLGQSTPPPLTVLLRHAHDAVALQWQLHSANLPSNCIGIQPLYIQKEIALLLGLLYAHGMQDPAWKSGPCQLGTDILAAFVDATLSYGKGHVDSANASSDERSQLTQRMAQEMHQHPQGIWRFLIGETHLQGAQRNFAAFGRFLNLPLALQHDAGALLTQADVWGLFASHPMPQDQREQLRQQVQAFMDVTAGLSVPQVLQHVTSMAQRHARALRQGRGFDFQLIDIAHAKGHEFDAVALPFLEPGRFPAPCAYEQKFVERNRLYVAMTRAKRQLWLIESAQRPLQFMDVR